MTNLLRPFDVERCVLIRQSLMEISGPDGELIQQVPEEQLQSKHVHPLDTTDRRHIANIRFTSLVYRCTSVLCPEIAISSWLVLPASLHR
jgi:hypothetical protein